MRMGRTLAIDLGSKRTGAAISDPLNITAQPVGVFEGIGYKPLRGWITGLMKKYDIERIIVGHPVNLNMSVGERAIASEKFAKKLEKDTGLEIILWNERFTTVEAERVLITFGTRRQKRKKVIDQMAAQLILSSWLDSRKSSSQENL